MKFILIHGAPAGPATWRWVAEVLTSAGHEVVVPDLIRAAMSGQPAAVVRDAVAACSTDTDVVAGHSGASLILPAIADSFPSSARPRLVFVDAAIPECEGDARLNPVVVDLLRPLAVEGVLPPGFLWLDSFTKLAQGDDDTMGGYVPFLSPDNLDTSKKTLMVQEDTDGAKVWQYRLRQETWRPVATVNDPDGESSGIVDVSEWFGGGTWLLDVQGHGVWIDESFDPETGVTSKLESGQVMLMKIPGS